MNTRTFSQSDATAPAMPPRARGLWSEACDWVGWLLSMFDRDALRTKGVSRQTGARLGIWLMNIEGAVRRLILTAAFAFKLPGYWRKPGRSDTRSRVAAPSSRRASFCVFRLRGMGDAPKPRPANSGDAKPREPKPYGHIRFPADPLLSLGATPRAARERSSTPRARNPLDRWGRLSRQDPDWRPPEQAMRFAHESTPHPAPPKPRTRPAPHNPEALEAGLPASLHDWRRRHDEWLKPVPAPDFAARLDALQRVAINPSAAITRAARRLALSHNRALTLARQASSEMDPPRRAAHIVTAGHSEAFFRSCHIALITPDTS